LPTRAIKIATDPTNVNRKNLMPHIPVSAHPRLPIKKYIGPSESSKTHKQKEIQSQKNGPAFPILKTATRRNIPWPSSRFPRGNDSQRGDKRR